MWQNKLYILLQKIVIFLIGIFLTIFSIFTFLALCSFHPEDPSFNSSATIPNIANWMGIFGSHISDLLFQIIGIAAFFLCLILFKIGVRISSRGSKKDIITKNILLPIFLLSSSTFLAFLPEPDWWIFSSLGGVNGFFLLHTIFLPQILTAFLALLLSIATFLHIIEIKISDIIYFYRFFQYFYQIYF
jgi:S-DNA-T family DNA segregation ATPase FtsK/SpoIIIE